VVRSRFLVCPIHVGRDQEIAALVESAMAARRGGRTVLISGEAGVGKSRLAAEAVRIAEREGYLRLVGHCVEGATAAYAPIVEALRRYTRGLSSNALQACFDGPAAPAAALLPEVAGALSIVQRTFVEQLDQIDGAVWQLLGRLTHDRPALLLIEDLHWAGVDTLRLISSLVREAEELPLWLVGTYRSDELNRRHPMTKLLAELSRQRRHEELRLTPLEAPDVGTMVAAMLDGATADAGLVDAVSARSGGNPFFVEELCRALLERGPLAGDAARLVEVGLPSTVRDALLARLRHLDADVVRVLCLAGVAGDSLDLPVLAAASGLPPATVRGAVTAGIDHQILVEQRDALGPSYHFRHALTREALVEELVGPERQEAHRLLAEAIEAATPDMDDAAAVLAGHWSEAGEPRRAAPCALRAARQAVRVRALAEAIAWFERALLLFEGDAPERLEIVLEAAEAALTPRLRHAAARFGEQARALAREAGDPVAEARATIALAVDRWWAGDTTGAIARDREAVALVAGRGDRWELRCLSYLARHCALADLVDDAAEVLPVALALATELGAVREVGILENTRGCLARDEDEAADAFGKAIACARDAGDHLGTIVGLINAGYQDIWFGDLRRARASLGDAFRLAERVVPDNAVYAEVGDAWAQLLIGEADGALTTVQKHVGHPEPPIRVVALTVAADAHRLLGHVDAARASAEAAWDLARETGEGQRTVPASGALLRARSGDGLATVRTVIRSALTEARRMAWLGPHWPFSVDAAALLVEHGAHDDLAELVDAVEELTTSAYRQNLAALRSCQGLLAAAEGRSDDARGLLSEAAGIYRTMPCAPREAEALLAVADLEWRRGDAAASAAAAEPAHHLAEEVGSPQLLARCVAALRRAGARVPGAPRSRSADRPGGLSSRELEVAALVAGGLSNASIGKRLFLSERTVANHVGNILTKLDLNTRAQIAAWVVAQGLAPRA